MERRDVMRALPRVFLFPSSPRIVIIILLLLLHCTTNKTLFFYQLLRVRSVSFVFISRTRYDIIHRI